MRPTTNNLRQRCFEALNLPPGASTKQVVDLLKDRLPEAALEELVQVRTKRRMRDALTRRGVNFDALCEFVETVGGVVFGSCPLACVLDQDWFDDVDVMVPEVGNDVVRLWGKRIFPGQRTTEIYIPRYVCSHAAVANGDPELFSYHREHRTERQNWTLSSPRTSTGFSRVDCSTPTCCSSTELRFVLGGKAC